MYFYLKVKFGKKKNIGFGGSGGLQDGCLVKDLDREEVNNGQDLEKE